MVGVPGNINSDNSGVNQCLSSCPEGSLINTATNICEICYELCKTCSEALNSNACLDCIDGYTLILNACIQNIKIRPKMTKLSLNEYKLIFDQ